MARRVLLTGAAGLLGTWLRRTAPREVELTSLVRATPVGGRTVVADLRDPGATRIAVRAAAPDLVVHAAYAVDERSIVDASANVARAAAACGAGLLLVSTDAVFAGDGRRRDEAAEPDPVWDYGRWKARAERDADALVPGATVVRLPLVVSIDPDDAAAARIRRSAARGDATTWFDDERRQPANAGELARALWAIAQLPADRRAGPWHLMGPERLSRHQIGQRIATALGIGADLVRAEPTPDGLARPRDLLLGDDRARRAVGWAPTPIVDRG
ncbi:MAG: sugar nucleotide-binding protein [Acidimicrobiales bacterium]